MIRTRACIEITVVQFIMDIFQKVRITASDLCGLNYAISSFLQLLTIYSKEEPAAIPQLIINDHPSLKHRAVFIDVTQERIPTIVSI